jgi:hypothetical protein
MYNHLLRLYAEQDVNLDVIPKYPLHYTLHPVFRETYPEAIHYGDRMCSTQN